MKGVTHILPSDYGHLNLTLGQRRGKVSTVFSRGLAAGRNFIALPRGALIHIILPLLKSQLL